MAADMGRLPTGVMDLDLILGGGLEAGSLVILAGAPGTGKTILAQQICFANATPEHKALYYTRSPSRTQNSCGTSSPLTSLSRRRSARPSTLSTWGNWWQRQARPASIRS